MGIADRGVAVAQDFRAHTRGDVDLIATEAGGAVIRLDGTEADCPGRDRQDSTYIIQGVVGAGQPARGDGISAHMSGALATARIRQRAAQGGRRIGAQQATVIHTTAAAEVGAVVVLCHGIGGDSQCRGEQGDGVGGACVGGRVIGGHEGVVAGQSAASAREQSSDIVASIGSNIFIV